MSGLGKRLRTQLARLMRAVVQEPRLVLYRLLSDNRAEGKAICAQPLLTSGLGKIVFERNVTIGLFSSPYFFSTYAYLEARNSTASIEIGKGTWISNNFCAIAEHSSIRIGQNCRIGANVEILDSDFHGVRVQERAESRPEWTKPVRIGDDVFIGSNVTILKGASVGKGAIIASGAIVTSDIPDGVIAGGSPARPLKVIE